MFTAVHADPSGRVVVAHDRGACGWDGRDDVAIEDALPLPDGAELVPLPREARALGRDGRARPLGAGRHALAAVLPRGFLRALHPSYQETGAVGPLEPRAYAAVCADEDGRLHAAAVAVGEARPPLRADPSVPRADDRARRQLARCVRANSCAEALGALTCRGTAALPVGAPAVERPDAAIRIAADCTATVRERASLKPSADEVAAVATAHLRGGGGAVAFGRACEGEPLAAARLIEGALARILADAPGARVTLETSGSSPSALTRLASAGVTEATVRVAAGRRGTYERLHRPDGFGFADVRASLAAARDLGLRVRLAVLVLPGLTDRAAEAEALADLAQETGASVEPRDLPSDPQRAVALVPPDDGPLGVRALLARLGVG